MSLRYATLGIIETRPMTGYDLGQLFSASANWVWAAPLSQIYPLLAKLSAEGLISGTPGFSGKRSHTVYTITDAGRAELTAWLAEWHPAAPTRDPLLLQALFFDLIPEEAARLVLDRVIADERENIAEWSAHRDLLRAGDTPLLRDRLAARPAAQHERIKRIKAATFDGLVAQAEARVRWAERMIEALSETPIQH